MTHAADQDWDAPLSLRVVGAGVLVAGLLAAGSAGRVAAVDPIIGTPIPHEPAPISEITRINDALAVDLDGDGVRELLTLGAAHGNQDVIAVQATWVSAAGAALASNQVLLLASEGDHLVQVTTNGAARLLLVDRGGTIVPLIATTDFNTACCLSLWEVQAKGHRLALRRVADTQHFGLNLVAADMDSDSTDEVVVLEGPDHGVNFILAVGILRWDGDRFVRIGASVPAIDAQKAVILDAGDSDGLPGEEVLVTGPSTRGPHGVDRISLRSGGPVVERAAPADLALVVRLARGPAIVASYRGGSPEVWAWPRDGEPQRTSLSGDGAFVGAVIGEMDGTRLLLGLPGETPTGPFWTPSRPFWIGSVVVDGGIMAGGATREIGSDERADAFRVAQPTADPFARYDVGILEPYAGVIPGEISGTPEAFAFAGTLLWPDADPERLVAARDVALLPGLGPAGTVGPDGAWMALLPRRNPFSWSGTGGGQFVIVGQPPFWLDGTLRLVSTAAVLQPERDAGRLTPTFLGVAQSPRRADELLVRDEAVEAEVDGPPGTTVGWWTGETAAREVIGPEGLVRIRLLPPPGPDAADGTTVAAHVWAVTPAGHGYSGVWQVTVDRQPPRLDVSGDAPFLDLDPTLSGRTDPRGAVTVNGDPVTVARNGAFEVPVDVGLVPTDLRVVAVDPLGNRAEVVVSRVWPFDYRQLPFVPFAVLATLVAAVALYLRKPDSGPDHRRPDGGSTFEEIGG